MKKILLVLLIMLVALCAAACGYEEEAPMLQVENIKEKDEAIYKFEEIGDGKFIYDNEEVEDGNFIISEEETPIEDIPGYYYPQPAPESATEAKGATITPILLVCLILLILAALAFGGFVLVAAAVIIAIPIG